jgi:hypothetical protein
MGNYYDEHIYIEPTYQDQTATWVWHQMDMLIGKGSFAACLKMLRKQTTKLRTSYLENSRAASELYSPSRLAAFSRNDVKALVKWLGPLQPAIAMEMLRKALASPGVLPHETRAAFATVPFVFPQLVFGLNPEREGSRDTIEKIPEFMLRSLRDFGFYPVRLRSSFRPKYNGSISQSIGRNYRDVVSSVKEDLVARVRLTMDVHLRRKTRSFIAMLFRHGGPKCLRYLAEPETLEGTEVTRDSLAALAVFCRNGDDALSILGILEEVTPGFVSSVKDGAGNNLLWYLPLRDRIWIYDDSHRACRSYHPGDISRVRDFLLNAGCDPEERNAFGVSWDDARSSLGISGYTPVSRQLTLAV